MSLELISWRYFATFELFKHAFSYGKHFRAGVGHDVTMRSIVFLSSLIPSGNQYNGKTAQSVIASIQSQYIALSKILPPTMVRIRNEMDVALPSESFKTEGHFLPKDKSVEKDGPIYRAALTGLPADDQCHLDLGQASDTYNVSAMPLWTAQDQLGSAGENTVAALLRPITVRRTTKRQPRPSGPSLF